MLKKIYIYNNRKVQKKWIDDHYWSQNNVFQLLLWEAYSKWKLFKNPLLGSKATPFKMIQMKTLSQVTSCKVSVCLFVLQCTAQTPVLAFISISVLLRESLVPNRNSPYWGVASSSCICLFYYYFPVSCLINCR